MMKKQNFFLTTIFLIVFPLQLLAAEKETHGKVIKAFGGCSWDWSFAETLLHLNKTFPRVTTFKVANLNNEVDGRSLSTHDQVTAYLKSCVEASIFSKPQELPGSRLERAAYVATVGFRVSLEPIKLCGVPCKVHYHFENVPGLLLVAPQNAVEVTFAVKDMSNALQQILFNSPAQKRKPDKISSAQIPLVLTTVKIESVAGVIESKLVSENFERLIETLNKKYGTMEKPSEGEMIIRGTEGTTLTLEKHGKKHNLSFTITYQSLRLKNIAEESLEELRVKDELKKNEHKIDGYEKLEERSSEL